MSASLVPTTIHILDKEYVVSCPEDEQEALRESAAFLNRRMQEARAGGKVLGSERLAVMTALNVVHDYLGLLGEQTRRSDAFGTRLRVLEERIDRALMELAESEER